VRPPDKVSKYAEVAARSDGSDRAVIRAQNLKKCFGGFEVLRGVSLAAERGKVLTIIGASGSGKSTLLRCLNLLEIPSEGRISIGDISAEFGPTANRLKRYDINKLRSRTGMVFQSFNLWSHRTVLENVIEAPVYVHGQSRSEAIERAEALLNSVGLAEKRNSYPSTLSGGQQQRVAIARALAIEPVALLLDEPTSALDPELVGEVMSVLRALADQGRTMVVVTHEMSFARHISDEVIFLHEGSIAEIGTPDEVFGRSQSSRLKQFLSRLDQPASSEQTR
jgi:octopine/nopaline transport system ATP-binding protein